jgi:hypothetical protein
MGIGQVRPPRMLNGLCFVSTCLCEVTSWKKEALANQPTHGMRGLIHCVCQRPVLSKCHPDRVRM